MLDASFETILLLASALGLITSGLTEAAKRTFNIPVNFVPAVAVVIGAALGAGATFVNIDFMLRLWAGAIAGLSATGLYENIKNRSKDQG